MSSNHDRDFDRRQNGDDQSFILKSGSLKVTSKGTPISTVVTDGVVVTFWNRELCTVAMAHFLEPKTYSKESATARYGNVALTYIIQSLQKEGAINSFEVQLIGGAQNSKSGHTIGEKNILIAKSILTRYGISLVSEDCGGIKGRKVVFNTEEGEVLVIKTDKLRDEDWFKEVK